MSRQDDDRRDDRWGGRRDDRWGERDRNRNDDNGGPISNTIEATKEKLGYAKQKAEEEASRLKQKAEETAGYMKHEGKQVKEQTKQKAETATATARRLLPPGMDERDACEDFHRLLQNCLIRSDCDLRRCRMEMEALHNCCKHGFENVSRYCYWTPGNGVNDNRDGDKDDHGNRDRDRGRRGSFF